MLRKVPIDNKNKNSKTNFKYYCENCGHTISFYSFEPNKKVCRWCGRMNYKNDVDKFKSVLQKKMKEVNV